MFSLRDYQQSSVEGVRQSYMKGNKAPLLVLPTGGGKTIVFSHIAKSTSLRGKKVLILVHRVELLRQTADKLRGYGVRVGLVSPKYSPEYSAQVQVAMVQTMIRRLHYYEHFDLIITDEAHHAVASNYMKVIEYYNGCFQLGVTATPCRSDGRGLDENFDDLVVGPSVRDLIDKGFLVEPIVYASSSPPDLTGVTKTRKGDYSKKKLGAAMNKPSITGNCVNHYMDICRNDPGVAFCASVQHAEEVAADFRANGFKFYALHGNTDDALRNRLIKSLGDGSIHGLTSCDVISEGTDIPAIACAMLLRPTESLGLYLQQVGRALRPSEGKDCAIILDHAGNTFRHGFVDDDRTWSLEGSGRKKRKKDEDDEKPIVQCEQCYMVYSQFKKTCPGCGHVRVIKGRELERKEGSLKKLEAIDKERINRERRQMVRSARSLEDLQAVAKKMGYKPGWAKHIHNARLKKKR